MTLRPWFVSSLALTVLCAATHAFAQAPSAIYTWDNTGNPSPNIENWVKNFGTNTAIIDNVIPGSLRIIETGGVGADVAISDGANRVRESATNASGGTDVLGLDYLEFDLGHSGAGPIPVQFYVQASTGFTFVPLGPDLNVLPGVNTYQVPLTGLTVDQARYLRTIGFNARNHAAEGDVVWTLNEVRSGGTPLLIRDLATHNVGSPDSGRHGAIVNFDREAVQGGNIAAADQTGLSHNATGPGSLQWTDLGGQQGAAISWGNGAAWNGNTFNNRTADVSNYTDFVVRISATDPNNGGGTLGMNAFAHVNNFSFQSLEGGASRNIPIDGQFHVVHWPLAGVPHLNAMDQIGINLFAHSQDLIINVDLVRVSSLVPEPTSLALLGLAVAGCTACSRRVSRRNRG